MSSTGKKTLRYIVAIFLIFSLNFFIPRAMPGGSYHQLLGEDVMLTDSSVAELRSIMGLDLPLHQQYISYWQSILRLDLGTPTICIQMY